MIIFISIETKTLLTSLHRIDFFISHLRPNVGVEISVLTPDEFSKLESNNLTMFKKIKPEGVLYEL